MKSLLLNDHKQRKFLVMIPVLVVPFLFMLFWALGGGLQAAAKGEAPGAGLNATLPDAGESEKNSDKLSIYQQAAQDSLQRLEQMRNDPYYREPAYADTAAAMMAPGDDGFTGYSGDANVDGINARLQQLQRQVNEPPPYIPANPGGDIDRMQAMLEAAGNGSGQDPEMMQLEGMLDKILDIQNPQRARMKQQERSAKNRKQVYPVTANAKQDPVSLLSAELPVKVRKAAAAATNRDNAFYEWSATGDLESGTANAVSAVIHQTVTVVSGATIKMRITDDVFIGGRLIAKGTFVYGICALSGDRLNISLGSIRYRNTLFPVNLVAYDMDGVAGIYMPGAISRDVSKNAAQDAVQGVDYYSMDNSLTSQAAGVGIQAAKSLLSKKAKLIKVTVHGGYKLLLKDANANE